MSMSGIEAALDPFSAGAPMPHARRAAVATKKEPSQQPKTQNPMMLSTKDSAKVPAQKISAPSPQAKSANPLGNSFKEQETKKSMGKRTQSAFLTGLSAMTNSVSKTTKDSYDSVKDKAARASGEIAGSSMAQSLARMVSFTKDEHLKHLPKKFNPDNVKRTTMEYCLLCEAVFTGALGKNPVRHCKRCGKSICNVCSENRRQLSQDDTNSYRVCDKCDTELDNFRLKSNHAEVVKQQMSKMDFITRQVEQLDSEKHDDHDVKERQLEQLRMKIQDKDRRNLK